MERGKATIFIVYLALLINGVVSNHRGYKRSFNKIYNLICQIRAKMDDKVAKKYLNSFEQDVYRNYSSHREYIQSTFSDLTAGDNLDALVNAYNYNEDLGTYSYGKKTNSNFIKICISGAKGKVETYKTSNETNPAHNTKKVKEISTLALSEIVERHDSALVIVYAARLSEIDHILDVKAEDQNVKMLINEDGQMVISCAKAKKYVFRHLKTAIGVTRMFRMIVGKDYVKFEINVLVAGAAIKKDRVVSKSTIKVSSFTAKLNVDRISANVGLFTSENETNQLKSHSTHQGFLSVDKHDIKQTEKQVHITGGKGTAEKAANHVDAFYDKYKSIVGKARHKYN